MFWENLFLFARPNWSLFQDVDRIAEIARKVLVNILGSKLEGRSDHLGLQAKLFCYTL